MLAAVIHSPAPYEANAGVIVGRAPARATHVAVEAAGRRIALRRLGRRDDFRVGPTGLPPRDVTLVVRFLRSGRTVGVRRVPHVFGLPARAAAFRPPTLVDRGAQRGLARMGAGRGVVTGVWARNLATGRTASWNAGTPFTAASTLKLAIAIAALAGARGDPVRGPLWPLLVGAVRRSDNAAANALLVRVGGGTRTGGSARVNRVAALLGARRTDMYGGYVLDTRRAAAAADLPPAGADRRLRIPPGKHTTPRDLGLMLAALHAATLGRGPAARLGVSPREARAVLWLLIRADYPGLLAPGTSDPVAHKAGWLRAVQHDAGVVYTRRGALVVVVMTQRAAGVSYAASAVYGARVLRVLRPLR